MFRKYMGILAAVVLTLALAACNGDNEAKDTDKNKDQATEEKADQNKDKKQAQKIEKIDENKVVATVNGEEIKGSEYNKMVTTITNQMHMSGKDPFAEGNEDKIKDQAINNLVDKALLLQEAKDKGYEATDEEIETELEQIKAQFGDDKKFEEALAKQNVTVEELKDQYKDVVVVDKFVKKEVGEQKVTEEEMKQFYEDFSKDAENAPKYDETKGQIKDYLKQQKTQQEVAKIIEKLKENADIKIEV
ncbi:SurA N-terminal domain-containing protein [Pseudalkalibacillus caeni]|nr:SurA N-terminal domain-containing protein [Pseudalkalibacillus caeni]